MRPYKKILLMMLLLPAINASAQNCKFDKDEKDEFTGELVRKADQRLGSVTTHWNIILEQKGAKYYIGLRYLTSKTLTSVIKQGDKFYLKLENGKVVNVAADQDYTPTFYGANGGVQTTVTTRGEVTSETIKDLSSSAITDVKLIVGSTELTQSKIMSRQSENVMKYASCLLAK